MLSCKKYFLAQSFHQSDINRLPCACKKTFWQTSLSARLFHYAIFFLRPFRNALVISVRQRRLGGCSPLPKVWQVILRSRTILQVQRNWADSAKNTCQILRKYHEICSVAKTFSSPTPPFPHPQQGRPNLRLCVVLLLRNWKKLRHFKN
jgi:hypothetical protein